MLQNHGLWPAGIHVIMVIRKMYFSLHPLTGEQMKLSDSVTSAGRRLGRELEQLLTFHLHLQETNGVLQVLSF